jgi:spore maturation protein CgeB
LIKNLKILYIGYLYEGQTSLHRMNALEEIGCTVDGINFFPEKVRKKQKSFINSLVRKIVGPLDLADTNEKLLEMIEDRIYDVLWIEKGLTIRPNTLKKAKEIHPHLFILSYSPDDMFNPSNQTTKYINSIPIYDLHVTTKSYNVDELLGSGAKDVFFVGNAYESNLHRPLILTDEEKEKYGGDVGFIGDYEEDRAQKLVALAQAGIKVKIWGMKKWSRLVGKHSNLDVHPTPLWGEDYVKAINAFKIKLCFLRKVNRDLQTTRSVEIPACRIFMLAERTYEHVELFMEGEEAEFFNDVNELIEKCKYYLENEKDRKRISENGFRRCVTSGYDNKSRLNQVLEYVKSRRI